MRHAASNLPQLCILALQEVTELLQDPTASEVAVIVPSLDCDLAAKCPQERVDSSQLEGRIAVLWQQLRTPPASKLAMLQRFTQCATAAQAQRELLAWEQAAAAIQAREAALAAVLDVRC